MVDHTALGAGQEASLERQVHYNTSLGLFSIRVRYSKHISESILETFPVCQWRMALG